MKILVTYFTASFGNTKKIAEKIAQSLNANLSEIEPVEKYTKEDLNWMNQNSRSSLEMKDLSSRPAIKHSIDVSSYDVVFVGFPVWWYQEPTIIDTFLESQDFSKKIVVPFATSGSSSIGRKTIENFKRLCPSSLIKGGRVIKMNESDNQIASWAKTIVE